MRDAAVGSAASMAGLEIYGRGLLLGACTGSAAGAVGGFALAMASPDAVGGLALGGMTGLVVGVVAAACAGPLLVRRARPGAGRPTRADRAGLAALALVVSVGVWLLVTAGADELEMPTVIAAALSTTVAVAGISFGLTWAMRPAAPVPARL